MLRSFIGWLDDQVSGSGPVGLLGAMLGILSVGATLSAVFGTSTFKAAAVIAALIGVVGLILLLLAERSSFHQHDTTNRKLLARYCDALIEHSDAYWRLLRWKQTVIIEANGDTKSIIYVRARSEMENPGFFRMRLGAGWRQPAKYRKRVKVQVRSVEIDGVGGARCDQSLHWRDDTRLEVLVHFPNAIPHDGEFHIAMEVEWPGKSLPLIKNREPDDFMLRPSKGIEELQYVILLPPGEEAYYDRIGFVASSQNFSVSSRTTSTGQVEITLTGNPVPPTPQLGLRLDLKPRRARHRRRGTPAVEASYLSALVSSPPPRS